MIERTHCEQLDRDDPLAKVRSRFALPAGVIYLDGNSLGPMPATMPARLATVMDQWREDLITSWNRHGWHTAPQRIGAKIARLIGAAPHEVIVADSTSINLFKLLVAACRARPGRSVIVTEDGNFPTDRYIVDSVAELLGLTVRSAPRDALDASLDGDVAVVAVTQVDYRTGHLHDLGDVTAAAHNVGALMLWDLAHSAGVVPIDLRGVGADLAVGCGYKYLNGGPGAPAYVFVAEALQPDLRQPLTGWHGHAAPFALEDAYRPARGIDRLLCGTAPVLSLLALEEGMEIFHDIDMTDVRQKSQALTSLFIELVETRLADRGFELATPRDAARRGSQVSWGHEHAYAIMQALIAGGVIGDFREPNLLRFGFAPLYNQYVDVFDAVAAMIEVMDSDAWDRHEFRTRQEVT